MIKIRINVSLIIKKEKRNFSVFLPDYRSKVYRYPI